MFKIVVLVWLGLILASLGAALVFLVKDRGRGTRTVNALSWRIGLSVGLFVLLWIAYAAGWIRPHGIAPSPPPSAHSQ
ncbi:MAG: membrane protein [Gammaproteobacteria bacterium]|nr:MAG: membrane protein [Gammaproteobacteria bacterium]